MTPTPPDKSIVLRPNQLPAFQGSWTIGEIRKMGEDLVAWLESLSIIEAPKIDPPAESEKVQE